jgi:hypothetical protein
MHVKFVDNLIKINHNVTKKYPAETANQIHSTACANIAHKAIITNIIGLKKEQLFTLIHQVIHIFFIGAKCKIFVKTGGFVKIKTQHIVVVKG